MQAAAYCLSVYKMKAVKNILLTTFFLFVVHLLQLIGALLPDLWGVYCRMVLHVPSISLFLIGFLLPVTKLLNTACVLLVAAANNHRRDFHKDIHIIITIFHYIIYYISPYIFIYEYKNVNGWFHMKTSKTCCGHLTDFKATRLI